MAFVRILAVSGCSNDAMRSSSVCLLVLVLVLELALTLLSFSAESDLPSDTAE